MPAFTWRNEEINENSAIITDHCDEIRTLDLQNRETEALTTYVAISNTFN